jgi:hypothetical protein
MIVVSLLLLRGIQQMEIGRFGEALSDLSLLPLVGLLAGVAIGALFGWRRSVPLGNLWQRGVIAVLAAVGALLIAFLFAKPAEIFFGFAGLAVLGLAAAAFGVAGSRWALRGSGAPGAGGGP